jgi:LmbE family N-acetylglucosaminyl deacetylase
MKCHSYNRCMTKHVYLSPHLDDAVFSCGGLIAKQAAAGEAVTILTVCAGDPPEDLLPELARALHMVWQTTGSPIAARRVEDMAASKRLGAGALHLEVFDAIYRLDKSGEPIYPTFDDVFGPLHPAECDLPQELARSLSSHCPAEARLYVPLAIGGHVDHRLTRLAAESLGRSLFFYRDMPYAFRGRLLPAELPEPSGVEYVINLDKAEIDAWNEAVLEYHSQISSFWDSDSAVREELQAYHDAVGGLKLIEKS